MAYGKRDIEVEEPDAKDKTDDNADAGSEILGDVIGVVDTKRRQDATNSLENNGSPDDTAVAVEEAVLGNFGPILEDDADEQRWEE